MQTDKKGAYIDIVLCFGKDRWNIYLYLVKLDFFGHLTLTCTKGDNKPCPNSIKKMNKYW